MEDNVKHNFLSTYQTIEFSKTNTDNLTEIADINRKCLFTKYAICKNNPNKSSLVALCHAELKKYVDLIDGRTALNNYWQQFNSLNVNTDNNPLEWKSNLTEPNVALKFLHNLPCNSEVNLGCKNKYYSNRDIEKMTLLWKNREGSPRIRKIPQQEPKYIENKEEKNKSEIKIVKRSFSPPKKEKDSTVNIRDSAVNNKYFNSENVNTVRVNNVSKTTRILMERSVQPSIENSSVQKEEKQDKRFAGFATAKSVLAVQQAKSNRQPSANKQQSFNSTQPPMKKSLGGRAVNSAYVCPFKDEQPKEEEPPEPTDERLKNIEPKMIELIKNEIMDSGNPISWDDVAGLNNAKRIIKEIVVFPMLRPDIFTGLRRPPKGILLFGPPGTGKTLIGKCIASQSKSTFFSISASSLTSKWIGEGEKMVRALFAVARVEQPSVVFIDEIDSLLCQRSETEHESSRRMKTEFLVQLDGAATGDEDRILVIGATNRPYELDEAARRRLVKRLYIPLPELEARVQIIQNLLKSEKHDLTSENIYEIAELANGYSGADMTNLCKEASMGPIRSIPFDQLEGISKEDVRKLTHFDFQEALRTIRPSVSQKDLSVYLDWDNMYGTASVQK